MHTCTYSTAQPQPPPPPPPAFRENLCVCDKHVLFTLVLSKHSYLLCRLRGIAAHRDHFVRRLSVRQSHFLGSHTFSVVSHSYVSQATHAFLGMLPLCFFSNRFCGQCHNLKIAHATCARFRPPKAPAPLLLTTPITGIYGVTQTFLETHLGQYYN